MIPWLPVGTSGFHLVVGAHSAPSGPDVFNESLRCLPCKAHVVFVTGLEVLGVDASDNTVDKEMVHGFLRVPIPDFFLLSLASIISVRHHQR